MFIYPNRVLDIGPGLHIYPAARKHECYGIVIAQMARSYSAKVKQTWEDEAIGGKQ